MNNIREYFKKLKAKQKLGKTLEEVLQVEMGKNSLPLSDTPIIKTNNDIYVVIDKTKICTAYKTFTKCFLMQSSRGNQYIMVGYHYDGNCILRKSNKKIEKQRHTWQNGNLCTICLQK